MAEKLDSLYKSILSYAALVPDEAGAIKMNHAFYDDSEEVQYVKIEGRSLVMPTEEQLRAYHPEKTVVFHPLQEFVNRGESDVVRLLRLQINVRINYTTLVVATALLKLAATSAEHKNLSPEQRELIRSVQAGDIATYARFSEFVVKRFADGPGRFFCNVYLKKAGTFQGQKHARVGVVQFPYYDLFGPESEIKFKKGDAEIFKSIIQFIYPDSDKDPEAYNGFSDHRDAPWLDCLLKTSYNLAQRLNELLRLYKPYIEDADAYFFEDGWLDPLENLEPYRAEIRRIPSQKGNEGTMEVDGQEISALKPIKAEVHVPAPAADRRGGITTVPTTVPVPQQRNLPPPEEPIFDRYGRCLNPPPAPDVRPNAEGKVDFRALKAANPMVAAAAMIQTPMTQWHANQAMPHYDPRLGPPGPGSYPAAAVDPWGRPIAPPGYYPPAQTTVYDPRFAGYPAAPGAAYDPYYPAAPYGRINPNL